jgi:hypothetical protein
MNSRDSQNISERTSVGLSVARRRGIRPYRNLSTDDHNSELKDYQLQYLKRKVAGLCTTTGCPAKTKTGHAHCRKHLRLMSKQHKTRYQSRALQTLCIYCGERPQFWGVRCVICRQRFANDPLPSGLRRALRAYREAEKKHEIELAQVEARFAARKLLASGDVMGASAEALRLYVGIDGGKWRTYEEVGSRMGISEERVRQLLKPLKGALSEIWGCEGPWKPATRLRLRKYNRKTRPKSSKFSHNKMPPPKHSAVQINVSQR